MYCIPFVFCLLVCWPSTTLLEVEGRLATTQYVLPRLLEERSSEGRLTLLVKDDMVLDLEKTSAFADTFDFVQLGEHTNLFEEMSSSSFRGDVYKDDKYHAAVLVSQEDGLRIKGILGGSLKIDYPENAAPNKDGHVWHSLDKIEHNTFDGIVSQLQDKLIGDDQKAERRSNEDEPAILSARNAGPIKRVTVKTTTTVETRVVVSSQYAAAFNSSDYSDVNNLFDYLRVLFAFVNDVCTLFKQDVLDLQVNVVGVVLLQWYARSLLRGAGRTNAELCKYLPYGGCTREAESLRSKVSLYEFIDGSSVAKFKKTTERFLRKFRNVDALQSETLTEFNTFIKKESSVFSRDDIVVYLTPYRIGRELPGGKIDQSGAGLAGVGGACTDHRGMLVTDIPKAFSGVYNVVHEMLHLLGSAHDGEAAPKYLKNSPGGTLCPGQGDFVMAAVHTGNKKLTFSSCTEKQVLAYLTNPLGHCLLTQVIRRTQVVTMEKMFLDRERFCRRMVTEVNNAKFLEHLDEKNDIKNCVLMCSWKKNNKRNVRLQSAPNYTPCEIAKTKVTKMCLQNSCSSIPNDLRSFVAVPKQKL